MTTSTVLPDLKPNQPENEEWPTLDKEPADRTRKQPDAQSFDATQGRKLGSNRYDDATQGRQIGSDPYDDGTRTR